MTASLSSRVWSFVRSFDYHLWFYLHQTPPMFWLKTWIVLDHSKHQLVFLPTFGSYVGQRHIGWVCSSICLSELVQNQAYSTALSVNFLEFSISSRTSLQSELLFRNDSPFDCVSNHPPRNIKMTKAQNGARIKAWAGPNVGSGIVKNITFQNFVESAVDNPVVIDQVREPFFFQFSRHINAIDISATWRTPRPARNFLPTHLFKTFGLTSMGSALTAIVICSTDLSPSITGTGTKSVVASLACSPDGRCSDINVNNLSLSCVPFFSIIFFCKLMWC